MNRARLTWEQKHAVVLECRRRGVNRGYRAILRVCDWARLTIHLSTNPSYRTIKRILDDTERIEMKALSTHSKMKNDLHVRSLAIENEMVMWIWEMYRKNVFLNDDVILAKAHRVQQRFNASLPPPSRTSLQFSRGWLSRFKKRNNFRRYRSHGESANVDSSAVEAELPLLRTLLSAFSLRDQFNCDEFALFYNQAPNSTVGPGRLPGHKKRKDRLTFMACVNADGSERVPPLVVGRARKPRCFSGREGRDLGYDYTHAKKAWMTRQIFFFWLRRFDDYIGKTTGRRAVLLMDNCSAHGSPDYLPELLHVHILFLPKNTTAQLQPLDAGVIASLKKRYKNQQAATAIDLIESGAVDNLYDCDVLTAMKRMYEIVECMEPSIINNCWRKTGISDEDDGGDHNIVVS